MNLHTNLDLTFDGSTKTTVFISHKHDDLDEIKGLIGLLERKYNIKAYIDSLDKSMPKKTSGETASEIKQRINRCNKFILLKEFIERIADGGN